MATWRAAGLNYLQYVNACTTLVRKAVKDTLKPKYELREKVYYKKFEFKDGVATTVEKVLVIEHPQTVTAQSS